MLNVCPSCHYLGKSKNTYSQDDFGSGLFRTIAGLVGLILGILLYEGIKGSQIVYFFIVLFVLVSGLRQLIRYKQGIICPNCEFTDMLPIDNKEAIEIIKKYDLQLSKN